MLQLIIKLLSPAWPSHSGFSWICPFLRHVPTPTQIIKSFSQGWKGRKRINSNKSFLSPQCVVLDKDRCTAQGQGAHRSPAQTIKHSYHSHFNQEKIKPPALNFNLKTSSPCKDRRSPCHVIDEPSQRCSKRGAGRYSWLCQIVPKLGHPLLRLSSCRARLTIFSDLVVLVGRLFLLEFTVAF